MLSVLALFLPVLPPDPAIAWFDRSLDAHRALRAASAKVSVTQNLNGKIARIDHELTYIRPNQIKLRIKEPEQQGRAASDRTFAIVNANMWAYDAIAHEQLSRKTIPTGTLIQKLGVAMGQLDDSVSVLIEPERMRIFLRAFRELKGWKVSQAGPLTVLTHREPRTRNTTIWRFETATSRLRELRMDIVGGRLEWKIAYGAAPRIVGWRPPKDATVVRSFTLRAGPPKYASPQAKAIANRAILAYDRLRHVHFWTEGAEGLQKVWISSGKAREEARGLTYVLAAGAGAIVDRNDKRFFSGKAGTNTMLEALAKLNHRMDPVVHQILARENPVRMLLQPGTTVSRIGEMSVQGVLGDILEFQAGPVQVSVVIRRDNGLMAAVRSKVKDPSGKVIQQNERSFIYGSVGKALEPTLFKLAVPAGFRKLPLSSLKG